MLYTYYLRRKAESTEQMNIAKQIKRFKQETKLGMQVLYEDTNHFYIEKKNFRKYISMFKESVDYYV